MIPDPDDFTGYSALDLCIDPSSISQDLGADALPLREMWTMVLVIAVVDYVAAKPTSRRFRSAKEWIFYGRDAANSFENVASILKFEPGRLRAGIAKLRGDALARPQETLTLLHELLALAGVSRQTLLRDCEDEAAS